MSLASAIASASSRNGTTATIGPKTSSRRTRASREAGASTVGANQKPGPSGALPRRDHGVAVVEERGDRLALAGGDQRTHLGRWVERVADADRLDVLGEQRREAIERRFLDEHPRARAAVLAGVGEHSAGRRRRGGLEIGVGEDHVRRLAAELERDALDRRGGGGGDRAPHLGRAREGDLRDVRVLDEPLPARAPRPDDDVDDPLGKSRVERQLGEAQRRQRRQLGGLEHDRVARRERRPELPSGDHEREVPRHDQADDAERLANREGLAAGDGDRVAEQALGRAGVVAEGVNDHRHLPARVADRLARVARLEQRELIEVGLDGVRKRAQLRRPRGGRKRPPGGETPPARGRRPRRPRPPPRGEPLRARPPWRARGCQRVRQPPERVEQSRRRRRVSSIVRTGPLNVLLAQPKYQIVTAAITPITISGA